MADAPTPPAGWYPDPSGGPRQRYWDGAQWTEGFRDPGGPVAEPPAWPTAAIHEVPEGDPTEGRNRRKMLIWSAVAVVGLLLLVGLTSQNEDADDVESASATSTTLGAEVRAAAKADYDAAVARDCEQVNAAITPENLTPPITVSWDEKFRVLGADPGQMLRAVRSCTAPRMDQVKAEAAAAEAQRQAEAAAAAAAAEEAAIAAAGPIDVDSIVKNPDAVKGQVYRVVANISQFDAATGPCNFRGAWDRTAQDYSFEYDGDNAMFSSGPSVSATADCPIFGGIDQDDTVSLIVRVQGSYSYGTQIGGNTTVPLFQVLRVTNVVKG
jgi:hypothetical protein